LFSHLVFVFVVVARARAFLRCNQSKRVEQMRFQPRERHVDEHIRVLLEAIGKPIAIENRIAAG